ncbi:RmlD-like substrate binding domain-containing protein [Gaertneriomyces semiglobifer]|nr:RmlD-like substrate binding domain-containing protein [Gaertneriomyces semiglobifer]
MPLIVSDVPRVVVTGGSGLLGRAVVKTLKEAGYDVVGTAFSRSGEGLVKLDLTDNDAVTAFIKEQSPRVIVHCAAERRPDVAQNNREGTRNLNEEIPRHLARLSKEHNIYLIYISTDYVFDGTQPPYDVDAKPNPLNFYGETKLGGEKAIQQEYPEAAILRVPILYGDVEYTGESAVNVLMDMVKKGDPVAVDDFQARYPTNVADVAKVLRQMIDKLVLDNKILSGIFHFSSKERFTKYDMAALLAKLTGTEASHLIAVRNPPTETNTSRPNNAQLSTKRLEQEKIDVTCVGFEDWWKTHLN